MTDPDPTARARRRLAVSNFIHRDDVEPLIDEIDRLRAEVTILRSVVSAATSTWEAVEIEHDDDCDWCPKCQGL